MDNSQAQTTPIRPEPYPPRTLTLNQGLVLCSARLWSCKPLKLSHGKPSFAGPCFRLWVAHGLGLGVGKPRIFVAELRIDGGGILYSFEILILI